ncbi:MAG: OmpA family protein [Saprospiraceae bacterium]|nr:OmpA family protein [Saprospiraceae bacterium]
MNSKFLVFLMILGLGLSSCVSKKKFTALQSELDAANSDLGKAGEDLNKMLVKLEKCEQERELLKGDQKELAIRNEQITDLKSQINDLKEQRAQQIKQVGDLTVLSQAANENIGATLKQLEGKDQYIQMVQAARTKADSMNLALAVNLKSVLSEGILDQDIDVKVDKTVVFVNLSDKMLYKFGSSKLTDRANEVLAKVASIIKSRPDLEVMVEGYTDNKQLKTNSCLKDNWDLSVKRATAVVRLLQDTHEIDPNRLIAAGRGEYNAIATNDTEEGRALNRRTRIIILPKLDQFYDILNPANVPE